MAETINKVDIEPFTFVTMNIKKFMGECEKVIGRGGYGEVCKTTLGVAIKKMNSGDVDSSVITEVSIHRYLGVHPNILDILAVQLQSNLPDDRSLYIALPLAKSSLSKVELDEKTRPFVYYQLLRALAYCHSRNVWHLDVKPDNVLVFWAPTSSQIPFYISLADFGLSRVKASERKQYTTYVFTLPYRAPELLMYDKGPGYYSGKVDVWSVGVMLYNDALIWPSHDTFPDSGGDFLLNGCLKILGYPPEESDYAKKWKENTRKKDFSLRPERERRRDVSLTDIKSSPSERALLEKIFEWPEKRITAYECLQEPYFDEVKLIIEHELPSPAIHVAKCNEIVADCNVPFDYSLIQRCFELDSVKRLQSEQLQADECGWFKLRERYGEDVLESRKICYEWLVEVSEKYKQSRGTIFYATVLMDNIADKLESKIKTDTFQMYSCACFLIGAYFHEEFPIPAFELVAESDNAFDVGKLNQAMIDVLTATEFNLLFSSAWDFVYHSYCDMFFCEEKLGASKLHQAANWTKNTLDELADIMLSLILDGNNVGKMSQSDYAMEALKRLSEKKV